MLSATLIHRALAPVPLIRNVRGRPRTARSCSALQRQRAIVPGSPFSANTSRSPPMRLERISRRWVGDPLDAVRIGLAEMSFAPSAKPIFEQGALALIERLDIDIALALVGAAGAGEEPRAAPRAQQKPRQQGQAEPPHSIVLDFGRPVRAGIDFLVPNAVAVSYSLPIVSPAPSARRPRPRRRESRVVSREGFREGAAAFVGRAILDA